MDSTVVAALIGAAGAVVAALIGLVAVLLGARRAAPNANPDNAAGAPAPGRPGGDRGRRRAWWPPNRFTAVVALTTVAIVGLVVLVVVVISPPGGCQQFVPLNVAGRTSH